MMANWFQVQWRQFTFWHILLLPLSWIFGAVVMVRRWCYRHGLLKSYRLTVPVIVVGNINVGGTGKTPVVIWLVEQLKAAGYQPGVISRGYGGKSRQAIEVLASSRPVEVGDEPVLIALRAACPVFVGADRVCAGQSLVKAHPDCNVIISDDGLQHYRLQRDVEIVVFDGAKGFGNGALLPAGPLRELESRLKTVDALVCNGPVQEGGHAVENRFIDMQLKPGVFYNLAIPEIRLEASAFINKKVVAVAGIGNPERFFQQLRLLGLSFKQHAFADHHVFQADDFEGGDAEVVLMTEKDAVKCKAFAKTNVWVLPVSAVINDALLSIILKKLNISRK